VLATAIVSVASAAIVLPSFLAFDSVARLAALSPAALASQIVVQGILSGIVAVVAFGLAVRRLGAGSAALFPSLVPVAATVIGVPVTGELLSTAQAAGLAVATIGLVWAMSARTPAAR
jgi:drug/metabolite transporter (DMT)-like permease